MSRPGELIAKDRVLAWSSPVEKTFRTLDLDAARAKFRLENVGGRSVRILDVQTTCGCTTPEIEPKVVNPGEIRLVEVRATPLQIGEKSVDITITTDSPVSPEVVLTLRIIGSRRGPYMFEVQGDLNFPAGTTGDDVRFVLVNQIEEAKSRPTPPFVKNELKFVQISNPELELEGPSSAPGMVHRRYVCKAKKRMADGDPSQSGRISVVDPWDPDHVETAHVHCEASVPIRVSPSRAILAVQNGTGGQRPSRGSSWPLANLSRISSSNWKVTRSHGSSWSGSRPRTANCTSFPSCRRMTTVPMGSIPSASEDRVRPIGFKSP